MKEAKEMWIWLDLQGSKIGVPHGLLRASEVGQFVDAEAAVRLLRDEVDGIHRRAHDQASALLADAERSARSLVEEADAQAQAMADRALEDARLHAQNEVMQAWHARRLDLALDQARTLEGQRDALARIVVVAVERVLRTEPGRGIFEKALAHVGELLRDATGATLRVHPDDGAAARDAVAATQGLRAPQAHIEVVCDAALKPGACLFDSVHGSLDASLDVQLDALRSAIDRACVQFSHEHASESNA